MTKTIAYQIFEPNITRDMRNNYNLDIASLRSEDFYIFRTNIVPLGKMRMRQ